MPPKASGQKQKKKGRAPAHQNTFAFQHNPKSKKTAKIMNSPVENCCRRCREKIIWRKQYRKYKPLTQPSTCNQCHRKCITSAYHTICKQCSSDSDAFRRVKKEYPEVERACAVCAKVPVDNSDIDDDEATEQGVDVGRRLKLREIKTLQRQRLRKENAGVDDRSSVESAGDEKDDNEHYCEGIDKLNLETRLEDSEDPNEDDLFLAAIGGKILAGKAYQEQVLSASTTSN